ncbi:MAG TPA: hypothetical protein VFC19_49490 [Candidatus Limnocylindrales bacterium]|nr:hypothetical protein [Candidatus Limnocylindrales bacterium]
MSLHYIPEITDGVLLSRLGEVHRQRTLHATGCAQPIPDRHATVSHAQAVVYRLPVCHVCYPPHPREAVTSR